MASYPIQYITADRDGQSLALKATRRHFVLQGLLIKFVIKCACTLTPLLGLQCTTVGTHEHLMAFIKRHTVQHSQWAHGAISSNWFER